MPVVDTHAHIYSPDEKRYPTIEKPLRVPGGKASLEDLRKESQANGVDRACLIQVSTYYRFDNRYICDSAVAASSWAAGVCTLNPDDPLSPKVLAHYAKAYGIRGMRSIPAADGRLDHPGVRALWKTANDNGVVINILIGREKADQAYKMLGDFPSLNVVLDHCLNLKAGNDMDATLADVLRLGERKNLHAKLTFIPTGSTTGYPCADMHAPCMRIVESYGAERCVWGSDFPCQLWTPKVTYAEHLRIFQKDLPFSSSQREAILGGTAMKLWFS